MKKLILALAIAGAAFGTGDNFPIIRSSLLGGEYRDIQIRKFDDGANTCYVAAIATTTHAATSISCVKR